MTTLNQDLIQYVLRQADTQLILAQRLCAWCGHAPELEIDLALSNIGLDLLGQARNFYSYAAELSGENVDEDSLAFGRDDLAFCNLLLAEQPNGGFNDTLVRQFFLDTYHFLLHQGLSQSSDPQLAAIGAKSLKEAEYHLRFSRGWMIRLGDGTELSQKKCSRRSTICGVSPANCSTATTWNVVSLSKASPSILKAFRHRGCKSYSKFCKKPRYSFLKERPTATAENKANTRNILDSC